MSVHPFPDEPACAATDAEGSRYRRTPVRRQVAQVLLPRKFRSGDALTESRAAAMLETLARLLLGSVVDTYLGPGRVDAHGFV
jgi:hypothetical protein